MTELSLHIFDIVSNSLRAHSDTVEIAVSIDCRQSGCDFLEIEISDNGCGMTEAQLESAFNPLPRIERGKRNGLGLSLFKEAVERTGGNIHIQSEHGQGTVVTAKFLLSSIDRLPLGDIALTVRLLITANPDVNICFSYSVFGESFSLSSAGLVDVLGDIPLSCREVTEFIEQYIGESISNLNKKYFLKGI